MKDVLKSFMLVLSCEICLANVIISLHHRSYIIISRVVVIGFTKIVFLPVQFADS